MKAEASRAQAEAELGNVARAFTASAAGGAERTATFYPMENGHPDLREIGAAAWMAFAVVGVVLLIACFNVAALLMARAAERQKEISLRCAVGASRGRILRQLLTEGLLLAALGGAASLIVAAWCGDLLATFSLPAPIPQRVHLGVDRMLVGFTLLMVLIAGVVPTLLPALQATRKDLLRSMRMESALGGRPSRTRNAFVVAQIAGSTVFMVAALLFVRSFMNSASADTGFDTTHTAVLQVSPGDHGYDAERSRIFFESLQDRLAALPGVRHAAMADRLPFYVGSAKSQEYTVDAADCSVTECPQASVYSLGPGFFAALGVPLETGRELSEQDGQAGEAVVISRHLAGQLWPGRDAIGRILRIGDKREAAEVVGIAGDVTHRTLAEKAGAYIYRTLRSDDYADGLSIVIRTHGEPRLLLTAIREQVRALDADVPARSLETMRERMKMPLWPARTAAGFFTICATLAVALGSIGLFGVMYFTVAQRTSEFGLRTALGATRRRVITLVVREGLRLTVPGVLLGGVAGYIVGRLLARALFGISPADPVTFTTTAILQVLVALLACALPAWQATKAHPIETLREE